MFAVRKTSEVFRLVMQLRSLEARHRINKLNMKINAPHRPHTFLSTSDLLRSLWGGLLTAGILGLTGCASTPPPVTSTASDEVIGGYRNACLPEAAIMAQALLRNGIPARVLIISGQGWSHAVTAYQYPPNQGQIWCWDSDGQSLRVSARWTSSEILANAWMRASHRNDHVLYSRFE